MQVKFNARTGQIIAFFILGLLIGGTAVNTAIGYRLDSLSLENKKLEDELETSRNELEEIKQNQTRQQARVVTAISPQVDFSNVEYLAYEEDSLQLSLEKEVVKLLEPLRGQNVNNLDPLVICKIVDNRIVEVEDKKFSLSVKLLAVAENIQVYVIATPHTSSSKEE